jgi:hypothetical protein
LRAQQPKLSQNPYLLATVLYAALLFAPSGACLLWEFPDWETMQAGSRDLPAWLVSCFAITNVSQAMLGFVVVERLLVRRRAYLAYLQVQFAYLAMLFVLVHGWDGKGYQRFFSPDHASFLAWNGDWSAWLTSDVALTLYAMGAVLIPVLPGIVARWGGARAVAVLLGTVFGAALGLAVVSSLLIHALGPPLGIPAALGVIALALVPGGPVHLLAGVLRLQQRSRQPLRHGVDSDEEWTHEGGGGRRGAHRERLLSAP